MLKKVGENRATASQMVRLFCVAPIRASNGRDPMPGPCIVAEANESELSPKPGAARRPETDTPSVRAFGLFRGWSFPVVAPIIFACAAELVDFRHTSHISSRFSRAVEWGHLQAR
jgi:hypothetical protein